MLLQIISEKWNTGKTLTKNPAIVMMGPCLHMQLIYCLILLARFGGLIFGMVIKVLTAYAFRIDAAILVYGLLRAAGLPLILLLGLHIYLRACR